MTRRCLLWALLIGVIAGALRFPLLDNRPMHADEAILADKFGTLLEHHEYRYDPNEFHGPLLLRAALPSAWLFRQTDYASLTETSLRSVPAVAGVLLALSPLLLVPAIELAPAAAAGLLVATSPACVYYSRYFIPEMLLPLFTALFLACVLRSWWVAAGVFAALALATKETALIPIAFVLLRKPSWRFFAAFLAVLVLCITPVDLARAFAVYAGRGFSASVHAQPPNYYLELLLHEPVILLLGAAAFLVPASNFLRVYAAGLLAVYSLIYYKTPWCIVSIVYALALLGGIAVWHWRTAIAATILVLASIVQFWLAIDASYRNPTRSVWAYAQTGEDVFAVLKSLPDRTTSIGVYTTQNIWPLPWYLRSHPNVHWYRGVPLAGEAEPIVLATPEVEPALQRKLYEIPPPGHRELYMRLIEAPVFLRPGLEIRAYIRRSNWEQTR